MTAITISPTATLAELLAVPLAVWQGQPTIESGHFDDLKFQSKAFRVWTSRQSLADYDGDARMYTRERMTVESLIAGIWVRVNKYGTPVQP